MKKITFCLMLLFCCSLTFAQQLNINNPKPVSKAPPSKTMQTQNKPNFADPNVANDQRCGTMPGVEYRVANDPAYAKFYNEARAIAKNNQEKIPCDGTNSIVVPVAFHFAPGVVTCGDTDCLLAEIQDQMDAMNLAFGDNTGSNDEANCPSAYQDANGNSVASTGTCISFCLAVPPAGNAQGLDPACDPPITIGEFTGGFNAGGNGAPGWGGIMNLFIVNDNNCLGVADGIPGAGNGDGVSTCASAFGGFGGSAGCGLDTEPTYNLGATMVHEIGHYLGLFHTHVDGAPSCTDNDQAAPGPFNVDDTPIMANQFYGCPTGCVTNASQGTGGACGATNIPTANFMAYTDDACMSMFTEDQAAVMNYWANQLFGGSNNQCGSATPTELTSACENQTCTLICPASVDTPIAVTEDLCAALGTYNLPTDPTTVGLVLDDDSDAVYTWSTGGYLSAGGAATTSPVTLTNPAGCTPETLELFLNVDCGTTPLATTLDGGTVTLNVYPDPAQIAVTDLVTVTGEDTCNEPMVEATPDCAGLVVITPDAANPNFPVTTGSGTANYTITYNPDAAGAPDCCVTAGVEGELITDGDLENPGSWTEIEEVPAGTPNPNPFGVIGVSGGTLNGTNDAWLGGWGQSSLTGISQAINIDPLCSEVTLNFDYGGICNNGTLTLDILIGGVSLGIVDCTDGATTIGPIVIPTAGIPTGATTITFQAEEIGNDAPSVFLDNISLVSSNCVAPSNCDFPLAATYDCATTEYCDNICYVEYNANPAAGAVANATLCITPLTCADTPNATCLTTQTCDDNDPCTTNDMETIVTLTDEVCTACTGTIDQTSCDAACVTTQACDDNDPCTTGEQEVLAADGSVCTPCGLNATAVTPACDDVNATNYDANATCIDNTLCTYGSYCNNICFAEYTANPGANDTPDATLCVTPLGCADLATIDPSCITTGPCDDADPCTENEMATVIIATNTTCTDCGNGTAVTPACGDATATNYDANATCIDNTLCTYGSYCDNPCYVEYAPNPGANDTADPALCVTPLGCADLATIPATCITTQACDDNNPCTTGETATVILADNSVCTDCNGGAAVTPVCGDPTADNYVAGAACIDNGLCTYSVPLSIQIADPCNCLFGIDLDLDNINDLAREIITISGGDGNYTIDAVTGLVDNTNSPYPTGPTNFNITGYVPTGGATYSITVSDGSGNTVSLTGGPCEICPFQENIPTVGEWGLIILTLMMSITAIVGIRARRREEIYS